MQPDYTKSLEQIENDYWGSPTHNSHVVMTCHNMRTKPLREVTIEELRLVIGQGFSLEYLIPVAIEKLKDNILAEGDLFEGDLLSNIISEITFGYWRSHKKEWDTLVELLNQKEAVLAVLYSDKTIRNN